MFNARSRSAQCHCSVDVRTMPDTGTSVAGMVSGARRYPYKDGGMP